MADAGKERRTIAVTGTSRGIGAAIAIELARRGFTVGCLVRNGKRPDEAEAALHDRLVPIACDVTDETALKAAFKALAETTGGIDGLVNNAGVLGFVRPIHEERADARRALDINVVGVLNVGAHAARAMVEAGRGGTIVNVSSGAQCGLYHQGTYSASKAAVATYTYSWARDLEEHGIRVNAISPNAHTAQHDQLVAQVGHNPEVHLTSLPSREDCAAVVVWLLSDLSAAVNGQVARVQADALTLMSHPLILAQKGAVERFTPETVAAAFERDLAAHVQPVGVAFAEVQPGPVIF